MIINPIPQSMEFVKDGRVRALAVTTPARLSALAELPTVNEFVPGYDAVGWYGIGAPKNTPADIVAKLNAATGTALADAAFKAKLATLGVEPMPKTAADMQKFIAAEDDKWGKVIHTANIKAE